MEIAAAIWLMLYGPSPKADFNIAPAPVYIEQTATLATYADIKGYGLPVLRVSPERPGEYGTPLPPVNIAANAPRDDGFDNVCFRMEDGSWTTAIMKDYAPSPDIYPYGGELDADTQAPAYATESRAWCAENAPS